MKSVTLHTIGYEASSIDDFVETLLQAGVHHLADVRQLPMSRRRGFSKNKLREALNAAGIEYSHHKHLGDPPDGRAAARAGDYGLFRKIFSQVLKSKEAKAEIATLISMVADTNVCLMCYERKPEECHRSMIAEVIRTQVNCKISNLGVRDGIASKSGNRTGSRAGQGNAARRQAAW